MDEQEEIRKAISALEAQRAALGNAAVDAAVAGLHRRLAALESPTDKKSPATSAPPWASERKRVTILFADISGFTAISEKTDPEEVRGNVNACFTDLLPVIQNYGGTVEKFIGDEIMAIFGAPAAHENDEERSLLAALGMMERLDRFNTRRSLDFKIHIGVNTGLVVTGSIGAPDQPQYGVMGDAVNLASRLVDLAESGQIFAGPETYRMTAPLFDFEPLEPVGVKGKSEPVAVYRVIKAKDKPGSVRGLEAEGIHSPLVGRQAETDAVHERIEKLLRGTGGIVGIIGEAGLGKTRLIAEMHAVAAARPLIWLEGYTLSFGQTISYWPFQVILRSWAGITPDDDEAEAWNKLESRVSAVFEGQTGEILPFLASLSAIEARGEYAERVKFLDSEAMGKQIFIATRRFFERLAHQQALVLVFEDVQWLDESSASLLEHLLPLCAAAPLLIIGASRPDTDTPAARLQRLLVDSYSDLYTELRLQPLTSDDSRQLIQNLLKIEDLPFRFQEMVVGQAEGNPFFVEEVIRTLIASGAVKRDTATGRWRATAQIETIAIPDTIQGVIMARIDRLSEEVKQVLRVASVIGRSFLYRVLQAVSDAGSQLDGSLAELEHVELINEKQLAPELEYIFKHALAQEATYESILYQKRRELHAAVGQVIEKQFAGRLEEFYGLLAYHYARAEAWEKAQEYLIKAGDQAGRMAADAEALAHYQQAMQAYAKSSHVLWDSVQQAELKRKIGEAFLRRGDNKRAHEFLIEALGHLGKSIPDSRTKLRQGILFELARQAGYRALSPKNNGGRAAKISPASQEEYHILISLGTVDVFLNQELFFYEALKGLNLAEQTQYAYGLALGYSGLALICDLIGFFRMAHPYHQRAIRLAQQVQHPYVMGMAYFCRGIDQAIQGNFSAALENAHLSSPCLKEAGDLHQWGLNQHTIAQVLVYQGKFDQAAGYGDEMFQMGQEAADESLKCLGWLIFGTIAKQTGQLSKAVAILEQAAQQAGAIPDYYSSFMACGELGQSYLLLGDQSKALQILEEGWEAAKTHRVGGNTMTPLTNGLTSAYLAALEHSHPFERGEWQRKTGNMCKTALSQGKKVWPGMPEAMRLRGLYAWLRGKPAEAMRWWERSAAEAERLGMRYELAMTLLEMGKRFEDPHRLEKAGAILDEMKGAKHQVYFREGTKNSPQPCG